jgi:IclR family KDG regulon transcriptional repressor
MTVNQHDIALDGGLDHQQRKSAGSVSGGELPAVPRLDTTLVKGFTVLEALTSSEVPLGISAISAQTGIGKSNTHRLLTTLMELGFVRKEDETRRYAPTLKMWEIGSQIVGRSMLRRAAQPVFRQLLGDGEEMIYVAVLSGTDILYLDKFGTFDGPRSKLRLGLRVPAIYTAGGKVLAAHQRDPRAFVERVFLASPEAPRVDIDKLMEEFETIRKNGYSLSVSGWSKGIVALAAPLIQGAQPPVAALGISVSADRVSIKDLKRRVPHLLDGAARVVESLGPPSGWI